MTNMESVNDESHTCQTDKWNIRNETNQ